MPLTSREDYEQINEHLWELDPIVKKFAQENGYEHGPPLTNGLYPKLRIWRTKNQISQNINFDMSLDQFDERFDHFFPDIPYSIFAGSWIDDQQERVRNHGPHSGLNHIPFSALKTSMIDLLEHFHECNERITKELIYACNSRSALHGHPLSGTTLYLQ